MLSDGVLSVAQSNTATSIPSSQLLEVTQGEYYSRIQTDYTESGDGVTLLNTLNQKRSGLYNDLTQGYNAYMYFTVDINSTYALSGAYGVTDVSTAGYVFIESSLRDLTASPYLFFERQSSYYTLNEHFVLGGMGGDDSNYLIGSLTGSLIAGHQYQWFNRAFSTAYHGPDGGTTATGYFQLDIDPVPDGGSTLMLLCLTVLSLAAFRRKVSPV
jgi:hypothetical protein